MNKDFIASALIAAGLAGVSCGHNPPPSSQSPPIDSKPVVEEQHAQPPYNTIDDIVRIKGTAIGADAAVHQFAPTRFDAQLQSGLYVAMTPYLDENAPEGEGFMEGTFHVQGTLKRDSTGKTIFIHSIGGNSQFPLYDLTSIASTLDFPYHFEVNRGGDYGPITLYGSKTEEARMLPGGMPRLLVHISDPEAYVSVLSPSAPWNGAFRLVAEKTDLVDKVGKPVYREVSLTPFPSSDVYVRSSK